MTTDTVPHMPRHQPVTLEELAARAGVSPGTVSRVLNGKNKENRPAIAKRSEEIRQLAIRLGYRPNTAARSIIRGRFGAIAFVTCGDAGTDWYPISGLNGIHTAVERHEWRLMFNELPASKINNPKIVPQLFREAAVDGVIVNLLPVFSQQVVDYFEKQPLPCVLLNLKRKMRCVYPDEFSGSAVGVKWLHKRGHQRIGFFSRQFAPTPHYSAVDRFSGFERAMKALGLPSHRHLDLVAGPGIAQVPVLQRAEIFLKEFPDVQAVLCYEMEEAVCMAYAAERHGMRVPQQVEVMAFSERDVRGNTGLSIPTVSIPFMEVGREAVEMLRVMIEEGNREVPSVAVPYGHVTV
jgi:DNA-binding LacI/PurR family transcriptional regulator